MRTCADCGHVSSILPPGVLTEHNPVYRAEINGKPILLCARCVAARVAKGERVLVTDGVKRR